MRRHTYDVQRKSKGKEIFNLIFECTDELPQYVVIDEGKLRQVLVNIIGNAVKFTEEGGMPSEFEQIEIKTANII
jgi:signal transduction histidine kinase